MTQPQYWYLLVGNEVQLSSTITTPETADRAKSILWTIEEVVDETDPTSYGSGLSQAQINSSLSPDGLFRPLEFDPSVPNMHLQEYKITATAKYDKEKSDSTYITVYDPEQAYIVVTQEESTSEDIYDEETGIIRQNSVVKFDAEVIGLPYDYHEWSITGAEYSTIDKDDGTLTLSFHEEEFTNITISADSTFILGIGGTLDIRVRRITHDEIKAMVGTTETLTLNGTDFYVMSTSVSGDKEIVQVLTKNITGSSNYRSGTSTAYSGSTLATSVANWQTSWLNSGPFTTADIVTSANILTSAQVTALSSNIKAANSTYWTQTAASSSSSSATSYWTSTSYTYYNNTDLIGTPYYRWYYRSSYTTYRMYAINTSGVASITSFYRGSYTTRYSFSTSTTSSQTLTGTYYYYNAYATLGYSSSSYSSSTTSVSSWSSGVRPYLSFYLPQGVTESE